MSLCSITFFKILAISLRIMSHPSSVTPVNFTPITFSGDLSTFSTTARDGAPHLSSTAIVSAPNSIKLQVVSLAQVDWPSDLILDESTSLTGLNGAGISTYLLSPLALKVGSPVPFPVLTFPLPSMPITSGLVTMAPSVHLSKHMFPLLMPMLLPNSPLLI